MKARAIPLVLLTMVGCTRVEYLDYRGAQSWPTGSAFVQDIDGVGVYEGLPNRDYEVVGMVDVYDDKPFFHDDGTRKKVIKLTKEHKGDAIVWLSDRAVISGSYKMGTEHANPASLDTGRSSQPQMTITQVSQYVATTYTKALRSSLLIVKWK